MTVEIMSVEILTTDTIGGWGVVGVVSGSEQKRSQKKYNEGDAKNLGEKIICITVSYKEITACS